MKFKRILVVLLAFLFLPQISFGAGKSEYTFYGFSKDLKYCAFETYGVYDGSGFPYSKIYIVDTAKNKYAVKPIILCDSEGTYNDVKKVREANMKKASAYFKKFNIDKKNSGKRIFVNPKDKNVNAFKIGSKNYTLKLIEKNFDNKKTDLVKEKIFELQLINQNKSVKVLQKDASLPASRAYAFDYSLLAAYNSGNRIVVFVEYASHGFEGPDYSQMVVTGTLN